MLRWSFAILFRDDRFKFEISHGNKKETTNLEYPLDGIDIKDLFD